jgi:hypothetical protein
MNLTTIQILLIILGVTLVLCLALMLLNTTKKTTFVDIKEGFESSGDPVIDAIQNKLTSQSPDQLQKTVKLLQQRLVDYGYAPQLDSYVRKAELGMDDGKCSVSKAEDRDKYVSKSDLPLPGPRIDLSQYVKKSSIPPEKVCPTMPDIDYSKYVLKSTLPPNQQCPPCIAPKVKVSAGLCRECPPAPTCPPPQPCPQLKCPEPAPCVQKECPKCDEIRYIKVPTIITKTIKVDANGNVVSQEINSGVVSPREDLTEKKTSTTQPNNISNDAYKASIENKNTPVITRDNDMDIKNNNMMNKRNRDDEINRHLDNKKAKSPEPTDGSCILSSDNNIPSTTFPNSLTYIGYPSAELNSEFKKFGIYGP